MNFIVRYDNILPDHVLGDLTRGLENNISLVDGLGGKIQSSSWLIEKSRK